MANTKRTQKEIEKDCKKIREAAKTATSIKDIEKATDLSYVMIKTTLSKHPTIYKRIKEQLAINKKKAELEAKKQKEQEAKAKAEAKASKADSNIQMKSAIYNENVKSVGGFVIDASITGIDGLEDILLRICATKAKIILTSITIKELEKIQKFKDIQGVDARHILAMAAENYDSFETVLIDETLDTPDDCIIKYCAANKDNVTLLTSDKTMALKARMYSVQVQYFKQTENKVISNTVMPNNSKVRTLIPANRIGNKLFISKFQTNTQSISVYSNGIEYSDGIQELNVGDDVFIATKKSDYITFAHYKMISLYAENNCKLIYSKRFYDYNDMELLEAAYKSFMKDFKRRHNL